MGRRMMEWGGGEEDDGVGRRGGGGWSGEKGRRMMEWRAAQSLHVEQPGRNLRPGHFC